MQAKRPVRKLPGGNWERGYHDQNILYNFTKKI